jgi:hypothetical protein
MTVTELRSIAKEVGIHNFSLLETERQLILAIRNPIRPEPHPASIEDLARALSGRRRAASEAACP